MDAIDEDGQTALMWAAGSGHTDVARMLIEHNANVTIVDSKGLKALDWAITNGHEETECTIRTLIYRFCDDYVEGHGASPSRYLANGPAGFYEVDVPPGPVFGKRSCQHPPGKSPALRDYTS